MMHAVHLKFYDRVVCKYCTSTPTPLNLRNKTLYSTLNLQTIHCRNEQNMKLTNMIAKYIFKMAVRLSVASNCIQNCMNNGLNNVQINERM